MQIPVILLLSKKIKSKFEGKHELCFLYFNSTDLVFTSFQKVLLNGIPQKICFVFLLFAHLLYEFAGLEN